MHRVKVNGSKIRDLRRALNLTQQQLAEKVGCARGYLAQIENHHIDGMSEYMANRFTTALGIQNVSELSGLSQREEQEGQGAIDLLKYEQTLAEFWTEKHRGREPR